ncbi:MAG TPA: hypothetical protein VGO91_07555 [Pyrinomonadaceae bacterium]|nr:hypothetical protein [Pyrinomonadaceae bacterium]
MKKLIFSFSIILLFSISTVWGQGRCRQVRFQEGQTTAVLKGRVRYHKLFCYTLKARANQRMTVHVSSPRKDVRLTVEPDVSEDTNALEGAYDVADWEGALPENRNYRILVFPRQKGSATFTLEVTIR